jgi:hypothetical protein
MSLLQHLLGNATEIPADKAQQEFADVLISGEVVQRAFVLIRDMLAFTTHRIISVDKQGITGKRQNLTSIPYESISMFTRVSAGHIDWNAELHVWVKGRASPYPFQFYKGVDVNQVYQLLSHYVLGAPAALAPAQGHRSPSSQPQKEVVLEPYEDPFEKWQREQKEKESRDVPEA